MLSSTAYAQRMPEIKFFNGTLQDFQVAAKDKGVYSVLYLHGDNDDAKQILYDRRVMADTAVVEMLDTAAMVYQFNVNTDYNVALRYQLEDLPALILFDKNGWEISRLYGYRSPAEIVKFLKEIYE
jgi:hypothetical protein